MADGEHDEGRGGVREGVLQPEGRASQQLDLPGAQGREGGPQHGAGRPRRRVPHGQVGYDVH